MGILRILSIWLITTVISFADTTVVIKKDTPKVGDITTITTTTTTTLTPKTTTTYEYKTITSYGDIKVDNFNPFGPTSSPETERYPNAFDRNIYTKFLNFYSSGSGLNINYNDPTVINKISFTTANDSPERDPKNISIYGSTDKSTYTLIAGNLSLDPPNSRYTNYGIQFNNDTAYSNYRVIINNTKSNANSFQIAEIYLLGSVTNTVSYPITTTVYIPITTSLSSSVITYCWQMVPSTCPVSDTTQQSLSNISNTISNSITTPKIETSLSTKVETETHAMSLEPTTVTSLTTKDEQKNNQIEQASTSGNKETSLGSVQVDVKVKLQLDKLEKELKATEVTLKSAQELKIDSLKNNQPNLSIYENKLFYQPKQLVGVPNNSFYLQANLFQSPIYSGNNLDIYTSKDPLFGRQKKLNEIQDEMNDLIIQIEQLKRTKG